MATNDDLVELASEHSQSEVYSQEPNNNIPENVTLFYTDLDEADRYNVEMFLNRDEATIKGEWYLKNRLPMDIMELYVECYDDRKLASNSANGGFIFKPDNNSPKTSFDGIYYYKDSTYGDDIINQNKQLYKTDGTLAPEQYEGTTYECYYDNTTKQYYSVDGIVREIKKINNVDTLVIVNEKVYYQGDNNIFIEYGKQANDYNWTPYRAYSPHRKLQKIIFTKNPTHKQMRGFLEKVDYIRLYRPKNHLKWYTISPEEFQERVSIIQGFWGLPNLPGKPGDYKYSKRSGRWVTTNDVKHFESWNEYLPDDSKIIETHYLDPETWEEVTAYTPLSLWEKILRFLQKLWDKIKEIFGTVINGIANIFQNILNWFKNLFSKGEDSVNNANRINAFLVDMVGDVIEVDGKDGNNAYVYERNTNGELLDSSGEPAQDPSQAVKRILFGLPNETILKIDDEYYEYNGNFNLIETTPGRADAFSLGGKTILEYILEGIKQAYENAINTIGADQNAPTPEEIIKYDKDGDGKLSLIEKVPMWADRDREKRLELASKLGIEDRDGDGKISLQEILAALTPGEDDGVISGGAQISDIANDVATAVVNLSNAVKRQLKAVFNLFGLTAIANAITIT